LGEYKKAVTTFGYLGGKVNFLLCTYWMCIQSINLTASDTAESVHCSKSSGVNGSEVYYYNPFRCRMALTNLRRLGAGPWPYFAAVTYFVGVIFFAGGLVADLAPMPHRFAFWLKVMSYLWGSFFFVLGGLAECIENEVFTTLKCDNGWWSALLNFVGGLFFLAGSVPGFFEGSLAAYIGSFSFGVGSALYAVSSALMIIMWKDEQFGLTFMAALNNLGGAQGRPVVLLNTGDEEVVTETQTFSMRGAIFIMIYCTAATASTYNFFTSIVDMNKDGNSVSSILQRTFDVFLPCVFAHLLLALNAAVIKLPKAAPFRQLYVCCRVLSVLMMVNGTADLVETLVRA